MNEIDELVKMIEQVHYMKKLKDVSDDPIHGGIVDKIEFVFDSVDDIPEEDMVELATLLGKAIEKVEEIYDYLTDNEEKYVTAYSAECMGKGIKVNERCSECDTPLERAGCESYIPEPERSSKETLGKINGIEDRIDVFYIKDWIDAMLGKDEFEQKYKEED